MMYLVDNKILYNEDTGVIRLFEEVGTSIQLSKPASLLFYELLKGHHTLVSREHLTINVLEEHGYSGSSISLNVAVSEIRKAFRELGQETNLIKTIRGKGFQLDVSVIPSLRIESTEIACSSEYLTKGFNKHLFSLKYVIGFIIATTLFIHVMYNPLHFSSEVFERKEEIKRLGVYKNCTLFFITTPLFSFSEKTKNMIEKEMEKKKIDCSEKQINIFFSFFNKVISNNHSLLVCYKASSSHYERCITYRQITRQ